MTIENQKYDLVVRGAVGRGRRGDAVRAGGHADGRVGDGAAVAAGEAAARVSSARVAAAGVTTAGVTARVTACVTARVSLIGLVVLGHLDALLDVTELDADDSVVRHSVHGSGGSVMR